MNYLVAMGVAALGAVAIPGAAVAAPAAVGTVKVPLVNDCGNGAVNGACGQLDMIGTYAGVVKYRHKGNGDLRLMIQVRSAPPSSKYRLQIYCGTSAASPGTLIGELPDAVTVAAEGTAMAGPFEVLAGDVLAVCGTDVVGHIQLVDTPAGSVLAAGAIKLSAG